MSINKRKRFTLIEFMIVVAIVAIIAALTYPMFKASFSGTSSQDAKVISSPEPSNGVEDSAKPTLAE